MNRLFKKIATLFAISFICAGAQVFAQQITKFAVVDTWRVYQSYYRNSAPVRNYDSKKAEVQNEVNKRTQELVDLHDKKVEYEKSGDQTNAMKLDAEITKKADFLTEYTNAKNAELESLKKSLQNNDAFYKKLQETLAKIAESGGYSAILSLQDANAILWYSPSVDITDQVISELGL
jgi:outer membrane protein